MLKHIPESFMTGDNPFVRLTNVQTGTHRVDHELIFEPHHEGFLGIPHGGLAMGLSLDTWRRTAASRYPVHVRFKFAGSGLPIGELATFVVEADRANSRRMVTKITKQGDKRPYLQAEFEPTAASENDTRVPLRPSGEFRLLPYYRNCFVCGHHRTSPGLKRQFRVHQGDGEPITTVDWNGEADASQLAHSFLIGKDELHPAVIISIFDENTAWSGFMMTGGAALSVRLEFTLLRPVNKSESLLFVGWPGGIRGNPRAPRFFLAEGSVLSMTDPAGPEVVARGKGEWIIMEQYTNQIRENLLPRDDWRWIFPEK